MEKSLELSLENLATGNFETRWEAAKIISTWGEAAISPLLELLEAEEQDIELSWFIARILGELDSPLALKTLINLLVSTENDDVKIMAATALANFKEKAIAPFCELLKQDRWRLLAVRSLASINHPEAIEPLLTALEDPQPVVRATTLAALSNFTDDKICSFMVKALEDPSPEVRKQAIIGLSRFKKLPNLIELLQKRLKDEDLRVSRQAAIALSSCKTETAIEILLQTFLSSTTPVELQMEIARSLSWIETKEALVSLQTAIITIQNNQSTNLLLAKEIILVLGRIETTDLKPIAASILSNLLTSKNPVFQHSEIKQAIALGLGQLGVVKERESLKQLLKDEDAKVRLHANAALKKISQ